MRIHTQQNGAGLLKTLFLIPAALIALIVLYFIFCEGRKAYWDNEVKKLCEKDGGVRVFENLPINKNQLNELSKVAGYMYFAPASLSKPEAIAFSEISQVVIKNGNPRVARWEETIFRKKDKKLLAKATRFVRSGGDFPTYGFPSSFGCPTDLEIYKSAQSIFILQ